MEEEAPMLQVGTVTIERLNDTNHVTADVDGLMTVSGYRTGMERVTVRVPTKLLEPEELVNLLSMCHKCIRHLASLANCSAGGVNYRTRVWRRYWRNTVDAEHGEGLVFEEVIKDWLHNAGVGFIEYQNETLSFSLRAQTGPMLASFIGRVVNMMRWVKHWTRTYKLVGEQDFTWTTFNAISLKCERALPERRQARSVRPPVGEIALSAR